MTKQKPKIDDACICIRYIGVRPTDQAGKTSIRIPVQSSDEDVVRVVPVTPPSKAAAG
jgi:hypothetical protein